MSGAGGSDEPSLTEVLPSLAGVVLRDWNLVENAMRWSGDVGGHLGCDTEALGASPEAFLERVHPDDRERVRRVTEEGLDSAEGGWTCELRIRGADGEWVAVRERARVLRDESERPVRVLAVLRRATSAARLEDELRETNAALHERVKELRTLYRVSSVLLSDDDLDDICRRIVELLPPGWQYPSAAEAHLALDDRSFRTEGFRSTPWMQRAPIPGEDAPLGWIEIAYTEERPLHDEGPFLREEADLLDEIAQRIGDAVRRRRAEAERQRSELHFRRLAEHATDIITVLGPDATIRYESPSVERVLGYRPEELVGRSAFDVIHPDDRATVEEAFYLEADEEIGYIDPVEYRCLHKDGSWRYLESAGRGRSKQSDLDGVLIHTRDVTERKELEERLREARRLEAVGRLASGVAHDFNNLLTVIRGNTDLLAAGLSAEDPLRTEVDEILGAARRAASLTRDLLAFGRQETLRLREVDLGGAIDALRPAIEERLPEEVELQMSTAAGPARVRMDPELAREVLEDLVDNAREAMPDGGRLRVEVRAEEVVPGSPAARDGVGRGRWVVFSVADTGVGMSERHRDRAIEPFFSTKEGHTGLGLSSAFGLVKQTGGEMRIESSPGEGTTVEIYLPSVDEPVDEPVAEPVAEETAEEDG